MGTRRAAPTPRASRQVSNPPTLFDSLQYGFSQAVTVTGGRRVFLSGQVATDQAEVTVETTLGGQLRVCFDNIATALATVGASLRDVAMLRIYLVGEVQDELGAVGEELRRRFPADPPASTWLVVSGLARDDWLVEVEAEAIVAAEPSLSPMVSSQ